MAVIGANCIIDIYHGDDQPDWDKIKSAGVVAVIHKATEGLTFNDNQYLLRRTAAKAKVLLWGCYHFSNGADGTAQADHFLAYANPGDDELICLDCEPSHQPKNSAAPRVPDMNYDQLLTFITRIQEKTGRLPLVYGGSSLLGPLIAGKKGSLVNECPLWFAEYPNPPATSPQVPLPDGWAKWTLWQYTDGEYGPEPQTAYDTYACDRDTFNGTIADLRGQWPLTRRAPVAIAAASTASAHTSVG
jgi:lysozyme